MTRTDYDKIAHLYDEDEVRAKTVDRQLVKFLSRHTRQGAIKVLDIACGTGNQLVASKARFPEIEMWGVDNSAGMLDQARAKSRDITWIQADLDQDGRSLGTFDYVSSQFAYHHFRNKRALMENAFRNLRQDGWFSLVNMDVFASDDWYVYRFFPAARTADQRDFLRTEVLVAMAEEVGFELVSCETEKHSEQISIQEIYETCSRRHSCSELMTIRDSDYDAGVTRIRDRLQNESKAVVESSIAIVDIVFTKRK